MASAYPQDVAVPTLRCLRHHYLAPHQCPLDYSAAGARGGHGTMHRVHWHSVEARVHLINYYCHNRAF